MPDFTIEHHWHCHTSENWSKEVVGSKGKTYTVRWDRHSHKSQHEVQYDWSCSCPAYQHKRGYCKHIEQVKAMAVESGGRCGWTQFEEGGQPRDGKCPRCGGEIHSQGYAV
jgi:hypothetical protein